METELTAVKAERDELIKDHQRWQQKALTPEKRDSEALFLSADRILSDLRLGKQAAGYKAARKALDRFIREVRDD